MLLHLAPGRSLRWSPAWPAEEASVLFDRRSGDFWVLDHATRELLLQIEAAPGVTSEAVLAQGWWTDQHLNEVVASLLAAGVLAPVADSQAVPCG